MKKGGHSGRLFNNLIARRELMCNCVVVHHGIDLVFDL